MLALNPSILLGHTFGIALQMHFSLLRAEFILPWSMHNMKHYKPKNKILNSRICITSLKKNDQCISNILWDYLFQSKFHVYKNDKQIGDIYIYIYLNCSTPMVVL